MDTFRERLQNLIDIIASQKYIFGTLWPANTDLRAMIRYEYYFDSLWIPPPVTMFFVLVVVIAFTVVAVVVPSYHYGIGLHRFVYVRVPRRHSLKPSKLFGANRDGGNVKREECLSRQHDLLVPGDVCPNCARASSRCGANHRALPPPPAAPPIAAPTAAVPPMISRFLLACESDLMVKSPV
jgi:hypothetical protein